MQALRSVTAPIGAVATAVRRPQTYAGHAREATSTLITAALWPLGMRDPGPVSFPPATEPSPVAAPVLLVHGFGANKSNWLLVRRAIEQAGFRRVHAVNYNPLAADIPELARRVAERVEALRRHYAVDHVHLVGHSLGGVIGRYAVSVDDTPGVATCVTIASPHGGVRLARHGSPLARLSPLAAGLQLRPDSDVMRRLRQAAASGPGDTRYVAYYSNLDLIVAARRAMIVEPELEATNVLVKDHGHLSIMLSRRLATSVVAQLGAVEGLAGYGAPVRQLPVTRGGDATVERAPAPAPGRAARR